MPPRHSPSPVTEQPSAHVMTADPAAIRTAGQSITGHGENLRGMAEPAQLGEGCLGNLAQNTLGTLNRHIGNVGAATKSMGSWLCTCGGRLGDNARAIEGTEQDNADRFNRIHQPTETTPLLGEHGTTSRSPSPTHSPSPVPRGLDPEQQTVEQLHNLRHPDWTPQQWGAKRGLPNGEFTLTDDMKNVLDQHATRTDKPVTSELDHGMIDQSGGTGFKTGVNISQKLKFTYGEGQDPANHHYIRFSKSSKVTGGDIRTTEPGYVRFGDTTKPPGGTLRQGAAHDQINSALDHGFENAQWGLDGPAKEFSDAGRTTNEDKPGFATASDNFVYPMGMRSEFYGVLYDPQAGKIMNVTHYGGTFTKPGRGEPPQYQGGVF